MEEDGNPSWITFFLCMGVLAGYATFSVFNKYRVEGIDSSDDEEEEEDDAAVAAAVAQQLANRPAKAGGAKKRGTGAQPRRSKKTR